MPALPTSAVLATAAVVPYLWSADAPPTFLQTNLVSDVDGMAKATDPIVLDAFTHKKASLMRDLELRVSCSNIQTGVVQNIPVLGLIQNEQEWSRAPMGMKFPVFPVEPGISSIFPAQPPLDRENGEVNQSLARKLPRSPNREFA